MEMVTREEKLILQMKNIEAILTDSNAKDETKLFMIINQMSYVNELMNVITELLREKVGNSHLIEMASDTFVPFETK